MGRILIEISKKRVIWISAIFGYLVGEITSYLTSSIDNQMLNWSINLVSIVLSAVIAGLVTNHFSQKDEKLKTK